MKKKSFNNSNKKSVGNSNEKSTKSIDRRSINDFKSLLQYIFKGDDLLSHVLFFVVLFVLFKFILLPTIGFLMGTQYPMTVIVSSSMEQDLNSQSMCGESISNDDSTYWDVCGDFYENNLNISKNDFSTYSYSSGLNRGDVIIVFGKKFENIEEGDVILFKGQDKVTLEDNTEESLFYLRYGPIIHRVVNVTVNESGSFFTTKGDNNPAIMQKETNIPQEDVLGTAVFRIPYLGLINYYFYEYIIAPIRN